MAKQPLKTFTTGTPLATTDGVQGMAPMTMGETPRQRRRRKKAEKRGSAQTLRDYWAGHGHAGPSHGAERDAIMWGTPGDFDRCVAQVSEHMTPEQARGYCNLRHHDALGYYPATHARMDRGKMTTGTRHDVRDLPSGRFRTFQGEAKEAAAAIHEGRMAQAVDLIGSARALAATSEQRMVLDRLQESVARSHYGTAPIGSPVAARPSPEPRSPADASEGADSGLAIKVAQERVAAGSGAASGEFAAGQSGQNGKKDGKPEKRKGSSSAKKALRGKLKALRQRIASLEAELKKAKAAARTASSASTTSSAGGTSTASTPASAQTSSSSSSGGSSSPASTVSSLEGQIAALRTQEHSLENQLKGYGRMDIQKVGPHGYVHGWIKVGDGVAPGKAARAARNDQSGRTVMYNSQPVKVGKKLVHGEGKKEAYYSVSHAETGKKLGLATGSVLATAHSVRPGKNGETSDFDQHPNLGPGYYDSSAKKPAPAPELDAQGYDPDADEDGLEDDDEDESPTWAHGKSAPAQMPDPRVGSERDAWELMRRAGL